jgi:hypothetical protein
MEDSHAEALEVRQISRPASIMTMPGTQKDLEQVEKTHICPNETKPTPGSEKIEDPEKIVPDFVQEEPNCYITGWRLHCTTLGIVLSLLLVNLEVTIVGTSLVAITESLQGFSETSWVVSSYLVTYMGEYLNQCTFCKW